MTAKKASTPGHEAAAGVRAARARRKSAKAAAALADGSMTFRVRALHSEDHAEDHG